MFTEAKHAGDALDYSVKLKLFLELAQEEHVTKYKEVDKAGRKLLDAIAILSQRRLPRSLFPDQGLQDILTQVDKMVKNNYPDYELAASHISHYRDKELVTFSVDRVTHSLIVTFPVFIKDFKQPPLSLFEIETVPVDGGRDVLLANFHGPKSLKCTSINDGLAKPAPEHTYAVINREFLSDCQLDLEHASVLRQLSSCNKDKSSKLVMQFYINIAFWELLRKRSPQIADLVQPQFTDHRQTFDVRLFEGKQKRLDQPTDLEVFMERIDKNGKRILIRSETENSKPPKPLLPRWLHNTLVIVCTVFSTLLTLVVLLLMKKHFKMKSLIASLVISTLPPPPGVMAMRHSSGVLELPGISTMEPTLKYHLNHEIQSPSLDNLCKHCKKFIKYFLEKANPNNLKQNELMKAVALVESDKPERPKKVVCSYPITTMWSNVLGTMVICYAFVRYVRPMTSYRSYKYSRNCIFYLFIFCDHYYSPLKICPLRGHLQNYKIEDSGTDLELRLTRNWIYDTVNISWGDIQVLENQFPIKLPKSVIVPLRHKIKNRRMMSFDWDVQYMVKQGSNW